MERPDGGPHCQEVRHGAHLSQGIITNRDSLGGRCRLCETEVLAQWALDSPELQKRILIRQFSLQINATRK